MFPRKIIVHHSATKDSGTVSWGAIRRYHKQTLGWIDIGYHAGVELVESGGIISVEILMGRMWDVPGAHTVGQNNDSLGLCCVGDFDKDTPSEEVYRAAGKIIKLWMELFEIKKHNVYGHRYFSTKTCPGNNFVLDKLFS